MRWPRYAQMKDSGVEWLGSVPAHWEVKRLRFALTLNPSARETTQLALPADDEVSFVPMESVGERGGLALGATRPAADLLGTYTYFRNALRGIASAWLMQRVRHRSRGEESDRRL